LQKYPVTEYQPVYFAADSFESAKQKLQEFCKLIPRPFAVRYNPYTESVEVIDNKDKLLQMAYEMHGRFILCSSVAKNLIDLNIILMHRITVLIW